MSGLHDFNAELRDLATSSGQPDLINKLHIAEDQKKISIFSDPELGLIVAKPVIRDNEKTLLVWVAISRIKNGIECGMPFLFDLAKDSGVTKIEFRTKRKGFARAAAKYNFQPIGTDNDFYVFQAEV